jgi:pilus assembly protein FimV
MEEAVASGSPPPQTGLPSKPVSTAVDYLERVDLLIAVGNLREAENTVRLALAEDPVNTGLAAKLLDIQFARGNAEGFREEAERLRDMMEDTADPLWQHVVQMGRKLRPGDSLFGGSSEPSNPTSIAENAAPAMASAGDDEDLDLQLKWLYGQAQPAGQESLVSEAADLSDTQPEESEEEEVPPGSTPLETSLEVEQDTVAESFDLDWQSPALKSPAAESEQLEAEEDLEDRLQALDFDLEELAGQKPPVQARADEEETEDFEADLQTLDFDLEKAIEQDHGTTASTMEGGLADEGYVETKLDLALAYLDMEDPVGARTLLEEVLQEGSAGQKQRAAELMQRLSMKEESGEAMNIKTG